MRTYSPATGVHTSNLLPALYLQKEAEAEGMGDRYTPSTFALSTSKTCFLQVFQKDSAQVDLHGASFIILNNLPGQRQGPREWYWHFRQFLSDELEVTWCEIQPCLAKTKDAIVLIHVDDILFSGNSGYFHNIFPKKVPEPLLNKPCFAERCWFKYQLF